MRLEVGDKVYLKPDIKEGNIFEFDNKEISREVLLNTSFEITNLRKKSFYDEDDVCIKWIDGTDWWWGQIGSREPWTIMFISEKQYLRNKKLEEMGI